LQRLDRERHPTGIPSHNASSVARTIQKNRSH
jgi:hypothetical protein